MNFQGYVCWDADEIDHIAPIDVAGLEHEADMDSAVFVATHQPLRLLRTAGIGATDGEAIEEHDLLDEFTRPVGNDPQITVITGAVGTGKSHMVKWLHAQCAHRDGWHQVYVEKRNTNLRRVIETILAGLEGPRVSELRDQLQLASSSIGDFGEAKQKVLFELALKVGHPSGGGAVNSDVEQEVRNRLPTILTDPVLSAHLLREGGAVHRITRLGLEGLSRDDEDERDLFFREEDLPLTPADLLDAARPAQIAIRMLGGSQRMRDTAIEVLNRELAAAKAAVFVGTGVDLTTVFDEVRRELAARNLELVLYIEDLVLLHGIDKELAQVFTEGRGKAGDRCAMRVAIAVTEGYLASGLESLTSRAQHYNLNLRLGADVSADQARTFVGRYLNAIRVGTGRLKAARADSADESWVPNACDTCDYREPCHGGFGADANGFGFYPLNGVAVDRLVRLADAATGNEGRFDPRKVLRHVVRDPLRQATEELPTGRFPSESFAAAVDPTRSAVRVDVRASLEGSDDGPRLISLLGFWAKEPVSQVHDLDSVIHDAFHVRLTGTEPPIYIGPVGVTPPRRTTPIDYPEIEAWANNAQVLPGPRARSIRQFIFDAVLDRVRSSPTGVRVTGQGRRYQVGAIRFEENSVRIEAAAGGGAEITREFEISIDRNAKNAVILKALLAAAVGRWPAGSDREYAAFVQLVDGWADELVRKASTLQSDLDSAVRVLALTSQPQVAAETTAGGRLESILLQRPDESPRGAAWTAWAKSIRRARRHALDVVEIALTGAKGAGASSFLDAAPIVQTLDRAGRVRELGDELKGSEQLVEIQRDLRSQQRLTAQKVWSEVDKIADRLQDATSATQSWERLKVDVSEAVSAAHQSGLLSEAGARDRLDELAKAVPDDAVDLLAKLNRLPNDAERALWDLVPDPVPSLEALLAYCNAADGVLTDIERALEQDQSQGVAGIGVGAAVVAFRALADTIERVATGGW
jgi:hypothetical protein